MKTSLISATLILAAFGLAGCETSGGGAPLIVRQAPAPAPVVAIDPALGDPCTEAAMAKYFIEADRVTLLNSDPQGDATSITMRADTRDAVCIVSSKGKVLSLTDTTPKSANQIAAEEAAAAAKLAGPAEPAPAPKKKIKKAKKKLAAVKKPAVTPAAAAPIAPAAVEKPKV